MDLKEYFRSNGIKATWFAQQVGCSHRELYRIMNGETKYIDKYANAIEALTKGQVNREDLAPSNTKSNKNKQTDED